jgi:hypothetical protein
MLFKDKEIVMTSSSLFTYDKASWKREEIYIYPADEIISVLDFIKRELNDGVYSNLR